MAKKYEELTIADDFIFGKVTAEEAVSRALLKVLLQRPVGKLSGITTQKEIHDAEEAKFIRMDLYVREDNSIFDAEMQNRNKRSIESLFLGKRVRYYQSMIDTDFLGKRENYDKLPESTIIFICTFDPFGQGIWRYTFKNVCLESLEIAGTDCCDSSESGKNELVGSEGNRLYLDDYTTKIFYNCTYSGDEAPDGIQKFYDYVMKGVVSTDETAIIDEAVRRARLNSEWRSEYMKERLFLYDAKLDGREEGIQEGATAGSDLINRLGRLMNEAGRGDEFFKSTSDPDLQKKLLEEFGLSLEPLTI